MPRPKSGGTGTIYTSKRAHAVVARRRRAVDAKNVVMTGHIGRGFPAVKTAKRKGPPIGAAL